MKKLLCLCVLFILTGCGTVHTYPLPDYKKMTPDDVKEIPITQANAEWIANTCPSGNFSTNLRSLVATQQGLVIRKIRCLSEGKSKKEGTTTTAAVFTAPMTPTDN